MESIIILPDLHVPYHDKRALNAVLKYVEATKPHRLVVQLGDLLDLNQISKYDKDNLKALTERSVLADFKSAEKVIGEIKQASESEFVWIEGNHEDRLRIYGDKNPQIADTLDIPSYFTNVEYIPYWSQGTIYKVGKLMMIHGRWVNEFHAKKTVLSYAHNIVYGHTHDVQQYSYPRLGDNDTITGQSLGCLCRYDMEYMQGIPTKWQHAFGHMLVRPNGMFNLYVAKIFNGRFVGPDGNEYQG